MTANIVLSFGNSDELDDGIHNAVLFFLEFFIGVFYINEEFYSSIIVSENNEIIPHNKQMI